MKRAAAALLLLAFFAVHFLFNAAPRGAAGGTAAVPPGSTAAQLARRLHQDALTRSERWMRGMLRLTGADRRLRVGLYPVDPGESAFGIAWRVARGRSLTVRVTIPEGWTSDKIAERLEALNVCPAADFRAAVSSAAAEGFLFPDTYAMDPYVTGARARDAMTARFDDVWREETADLEARRGPSPRGDAVRAGGRWWTAAEIVTLASIVEREGGPEAERAMVAAVYHNRLRKGMRLEADPTVLFALGRWKERLLYRDLEVDSPYNTYRRAGLPPGPIGSPGRASLRAALRPAEGPWLYFVAAEGGGHAFAASFAEHRRNVAAFRRRRKALLSSPPS